MTFITDNFLLQSKTARQLYHEYAAGEAILDFHGHLHAADIARDRRFNNLAEIWLEGDHYKWRAMRANGVSEEFCTGQAEPFAKFLAWARTVPNTLGNPLYQWTHLELLRYFGIQDLLNESTAAQVWATANECLQHGGITAQGILKKFKVAFLCTTDDPANSLESHEQLATAGIETQVFPTFRPDGALRVQDPAEFNRWVERLGHQADVTITRFCDFLGAIQQRHDDFHEHGCRASDHGLATCPAAECTECDAARAFEKLRTGTVLDSSEGEKFCSFMMLFFGELDAAKGWTKQLHLGAIRDVNSRMKQRLGRDTGFDSIGDWPQVKSLCAYMDRLDQRQRLPKMVLFNVNPTDNYLLATLAGNFQDSQTPGKIQFGTAWWFLDQKEGIEWQLNALANCGLLARFIGMVTDSRSFMSFTRHEYFRRVLCNLLGRQMEEGLLPMDEELVGGLVKNICFANARDYFRLPARAVRSKDTILVEPR